MTSDLLRRQYDEMVSDNATLTAQLAAVTAERDALRARAERYERALYGPVPTGGMETLSGNECRLCCADAKPDEIDMHEDDCPLRRAALAAAASEGE